MKKKENSNRLFICILIFFLTNFYCKSQEYFVPDSIFTENENSILIYTPEAKIEEYANSPVLSLKIQSLEQALDSLILVHNLHSQKSYKSRIFVFDCKLLDSIKGEYNIAIYVEKDFQILTPEVKSGGIYRQNGAVFFGIMINDNPFFTYTGEIEQITYRRNAYRVRNRIIISDQGPFFHAFPYWNLIYNSKQDKYYLIYSEFVTRTEDM